MTTKRRKNLRKKRTKIILKKIKWLLIKINSSRRLKTR